MKRICFIIDNFTCGGGIERSLANISNSLDDNYRQYIIEVYSRENFPSKKVTQWENKAYRIINLNFKKRNKLLSYLLLPIRSYKLLKIKKELKIDYSISFGYYSNDINCRSLFNNTILTIHIFFKKNIINALRYRKYKNSNLIISVSKQIEYSLINDYKIPKEKTKTIYNMFDINQINQTNNSHAFNETKFNIVMIGRLETQKGYFHALKIMSYLNTIQSNRYCLNIFGEGALEKKLKKECLELGIADNVIFWGFKENIYSYLKDADIFLMTSLYEGFPMVNVEALACNVPVFSVDCDSGPRELLIKSRKKVEKPMECAYGYIFPNFEDRKLNKQYKEIALKIYEYDQLTILEKNTKRDNAFAKSLEFDKSIIIKEWYNVLK